MSDQIVLYEWSNMSKYSLWVLMSVQLFQFFLTSNGNPSLLSTVISYTPIIFVEYLQNLQKISLVSAHNKWPHIIPTIDIKIPTCWYHFVPVWPGDVTSCYQLPRHTTTPSRCHKGSRFRSLATIMHSDYSACHLGRRFFYFFHGLIKLAKTCCAGSISVPNCNTETCIREVSATHPNFDC